jgi:hypothetical protein
LLAVEEGRLRLPLFCWRLPGFELRSRTGLEARAEIFHVSLKAEVPRFFQILFCFLFSLGI